MGIPHLPGQLLPWRNSSWRHQKWDFFQEKNSHGIDILLENRNCCSKEGVAPPHPLSSVLRDPRAPELLTEHGKYPGKEAAISFSCFFSKNPKIPLLLSFTLCWIQICKFHPWGATEIFPERFFFFCFNYSGALFLKTLSFLSQNCCFASFQADTTSS